MTKDIKKTKKIVSPKKRPILTFQEVIIIIMLLGYLVIFAAYKHDIEQYQTVIDNPQRLCYIYYSNLNNLLVEQEVDLNGSMIHTYSVNDSNGS